MMVDCPYCGQEMKYITTPIAAQLLGVSVQTVRRRCRMGWYPGSKFVPGIHKDGVWRIPVSAVLPMLKEGE